MNMKERERFRREKEKTSEVDTGLVLDVDTGEEWGQREGDG